MNQLDHIEHILSGRQPRLVAPGGRTTAAVALIARERETGLEILFIERARMAGDPWSGDLGFPGGKREPFDRTLRGAAERETREEIGLDLRGARYLGRLDDVVGAHMPVRVACFVYGITGEVRLCLEAEIFDAFWVPLAELQSPGRHLDAQVSFAGEDFTRPAIRLPAEGKPLLWGLTYRLVMSFLALLETGTRSRREP